MEIHKYEKLWFGAALVLIIMFIATVTYGAVGAGITMVGDDGGTVAQEDISDHERFGNTGVYESADDDVDYDVNMIARHPQFVPRTVEIPEGSTVQFYITAEDVIHSYDIVGTNVNTMLIPGQIAEFKVEFDDSAEYGVLCSEYCGSLHHEMEGALNVIDEDEWEDEMADGVAREEDGEMVFEDWDEEGDD